MLKSPRISEFRTVLEDARPAWPLTPRCIDENSILVSEAATEVQYGLGPKHGEVDLGSQKVRYLKTGCIYRKRKEKKTTREQDLSD